MKTHRVLTLALVFYPFQPLTAFAQSCEHEWDVSIGNPGMDRGVNALAVHDDGTGPALYAGGQFLNAGGNPAMRIAKWDGQSWSPLGPGLGGDGTDLSSTVYALASYDDGNGPALYAGGLFNRSGDQVAINGIAVWRDDQWSALGAGLQEGGIGGEAFTLAVFDDGSGPALYVGGDFSLAGAVGSRGIAKWDGHLWSAVGLGFPGQINDLAVYDDGRGPALFVAGDSWQLDGNWMINKWNGQEWVPMPGGKPRGKWENYSPCPIGRFCPIYNPPSGHSLAVFDDGSGESLYLAGFFSGFGTTKVSRIAAWSGRRWSSLMGGYPNVEIVDLVSFDDGSGPALYAGGWNGGLERWNGRQWSELGGGISAAPVWAMVGYDDGSGNALYVGGRITAAGGQTTHNIARWKCSYQP